MHLRDNVIEPVAFEHGSQSDEGHRVGRCAEGLIDDEFGQDVRLGTAHTLCILSILFGRRLFRSAAWHECRERSLEPFLVEMIRGRDDESDRCED